jgi:5-methylcytosine-specific restriction endonuclease McrBC regulatory subunit McrC
MSIFIKINDNTIQSEVLPENILKSLIPFAGVKLSDLMKEHERLLIFPQCLNDNKDGIASQTIFKLNGGKLQTGNVLGFLGMKGVQLFIHSRFDSGERQHFLHYMLQRVFGINMVDFSTGTYRENLWDFLMYLFPYCLKRAVKQGLFKTYRRFEYNNERLRGTVDIARHLRENLPFTGRIAYHTREYSANNRLTQLIRHTVEFIFTDKRASGILNFDFDIRDAVKLIVDATPNYYRLERQKTIAWNLRPVRHPYLTEYSFLQKLCLQILRYEKISYGEDDTQIHGILFDGAWLWEEYLATILEPEGFKHPCNKTGRGRMYLYQDNSGYIYPDFLRNDLVLDAKYKRLDKKNDKGKRNGIGREDRFQMISYLHVTQAKYGYFIFPTEDLDCQGWSEGELNGHGGFIGALPFHIPTSDGDFSDFVVDMEQQTKSFKDKVEKVFEHERFENILCSP